MRKALLVFFSILITLFFILGYALDTGDYSRERTLWLIERDFQKLADHPESTPQYALDKIVDRYDRFIQKYSRSPLAPKAQLLKGEVYLFKNDYIKAREIFSDVVAKYSYNAEVVAQALIFTARSYEQEDKWKEANAIYERVIKNYPLTTAGFTIPAYLGYYYLSHGKDKEADDAFDDAVMFYQNVANYYPNSPLEYSALRMVSECRIAQKRWQDALDATRTWMFKYPSNGMLFEAIKTINDVCIGYLKEYDCAIDTYNQFIIQNPEHPIRPILQKMITNLQNVKNKKLTTVTR
jgi:tetratricopeptide (TPR) repeat protein